MCMNCGCGQVDERHGNQDNIVADDVRRAASASGLDVTTTVRNLQESLQRVAGGEMAASGTGNRPGTDRGRSGFEDASRG